jgi:hypothetical protein
MRLVLLMILTALAIASVGAPAATQNGISLPAQEVVSVPAWSEGLTPPAVKTSIGSYQGAPYSAKSTATWVEQRSDGSVVAHTKETLLYRDAEGRTRIEITQDKQIMKYDDRQGNTHTMDVTRMYGGDQHHITVEDPVEGKTFYWTIDEESAKKHVIVNRRAPRPPTNPTQTTPAQSGPQEKDPDTIKVSPFARNHVETLGAQTVNGLYAEGYRATTLLRDPRTGTDMTATTEEWLSPDLKIVVRKIFTDPRSSNENLPQVAVNRIEVTNVVRLDPDPELFKLPKEYEVVERK